MLCQNALPTAVWCTGLYALVCSTAVLAGVFRSAISLVVLVVEGTRGINFLFGIIVAVVVANWVANLLEQEGVYESELERDANVFFLRHDPPRKLSTLTAADIMVPNPMSFSSIASATKALRYLEDTAHHGFPVVEDRGEGDAGGHLEGLVLRSQLLVLLKERCVYNPRWRLSLRYAMLCIKYLRHDASNAQFVQCRQTASMPGECDASCMRKQPACVSPTSGALGS
jgi:CBS domain-containing protein